MPDIGIALRTDRLRKAREQKGWSQRELGRLCGIGATLIHKYETGQTDPLSSTLKLIADQLHISVDYLLGGTDEPLGHVGGGILSDEERQIVDTFRRNGWPGVIRLGGEQLSK